MKKPLERLQRLALFRRPAEEIPTPPTGPIVPHALPFRAWPGRTPDGTKIGPTWERGGDSAGPDGASAPPGTIDESPADGLIEPIEA